MAMAQINTTCCFLLLAACFMVPAKADGWDDFSNNLATDLAPLIALFGEQVTKQFLSESTTILDNFIFAMAPLGIITAVVSVIRVCGGPSLRAFIGRAQEGGGIAEAELCSSTSRDVCELYHNGAIVRVFGRPKILEIIHDREAAIPNDDNKTPPECGIYSFQDFIRKPLAKEAGWRELGKDSHDTAQAGQKKQAPPANGDIEDQWKPPQNPDNNDEQFAPNPNLSFNIGIREQPSYVIWLAAVTAFIIQASFLIFASLVTYTWRWTKDNAHPPGWAFPLTLSGSLFLDGGMFFCALLINNSTKERVFRRASIKGKDVQPIYVVQPGNQIIGDQTFDAFLFTDASHPLTQYTTSRKLQNKAELGVFLATGTTLVGFVLQFVGLRAMHSSVSVFQLGAILLVSIIRAGLRTQRLAKEHNLLRHRPDEVEGHELDWLALQMAGDGLEKQSKEQDGQQWKKRKFWAVTGGPLKPQTPQDGMQPRQGGGSGVTKRDLALRAFFYRSRLAELTSQSTHGKSKSSTVWDERLVQVRQQARQLKQAIESSASVLFAHGTIDPDWKKTESIPWVIRVAEYDEPRPGEQPALRESSTIDLSLYKGKSSDQSALWQVNQHYLEAVTGLWAWSIISDSRTEKRDEFGLWISKASETPASRILATAATVEEIEQARKELKMWIEDFPLFTIEKWQGGLCFTEGHPGILWETDTQVDTSVRNLSRNHPGQLRLYGWPIAPDGFPCDEFALTTTVTNSIPVTCAHDIYKSFICTMADALSSIGGDTKFSAVNGLLFTNEVVARLVECFKESGLGSNQDAYSIIIPALRSRSRLPLSRDPIRSIHIVAEKSREKGDFLGAEGILKFSWQAAFSLQSNELLAATMLEFGELYRNALFGKSESLEDFASKGISWMKEVARENKPVAAIADRYVNLERMSKEKLQPEVDIWGIIHATKTGDRTEALWLISHVKTVLPADGRGRTILSWAAEQGWPEMVKAALEFGRVVDEKDNIERTPLSYAAEHGHADAVEILIARGALPSTKDSFHRTALSYAAGGGHDHVMKILLDDPRVSLMTKDKHDSSPLHWAARKGCTGAITVLLQHGAREILDDSDRNGDSALMIAIRDFHMATAELLIKNGSPRDFHIDGIKSWEWAIRNFRWSAAALLLREYNRARQLREGVVITIKTECSRPPQGKRTSSPEDIQPEIMVYELAEGDTRIAVTMETIRDIIANGFSFKVQVCEQGGEIPKYDAPEIYLSPMKNFDGLEVCWIVGFLLDQLGSDGVITEEVVRAAASKDMGIVGFLLDRSGEEIHITESIVKAAASNPQFGSDIIRLLLDRRGNEVKITENIVQAAVSNRRDSKRIIQLLLDRRGNEVKITEYIVQAAAGNRRNGKRIMRLLRDRRGDKVKVAE
ncbi:hypothetical protein O1611_g6892 [Lasiodiplodia mahajangana]|uniref:Uncharacterized protein n=1 Tax=Lasiodiplodia mahajangana TaxID=1108764 RepID=A0ACC2JH15_9PEZI|nr:hypothetical protein O1611_g6892 [Lasiodiplodia mahajangana]